MDARPEDIDPVLACNELARGQDRLIGRDQIVSSGLSAKVISRLTTRGPWQRVLPRVYSTDGPLDGWKAHVRAAALWGSPDAALSHLTAATMWGLPVRRPEMIELSAERRLRAPAPWIKTHQASFLLPMDLRSDHGLRLTDPTRTVVDLAAVLDPATLEQSVEMAINKGLTSRARLRWRVQQRDVCGRRGMTVLRALLRKQQLVTTESPLELRFEQILRDAKLPPPVRQFPVIENGRLVARLDFAYPEAMIAIEIDGYAHHSGRKSWFHDRERRNKIVLLGWRPVHFTSESIDHDPGLVVERVKKLRGDSLF